MTIRPRLAAAVFCAGLIAFVVYAAESGARPGDSGDSGDDRTVERIARLLSPAELTFVDVGLNHHTRAIGVAAAELLWQKVSTSDAADAGMQALAAGTLLDHYLLVGLDDAALATHEAMDATLRERVTRGAMVNGEWSSDPEDYRSPSLDLDVNPAITAASLAVAATEAGRNELAEALLADAEGWASSAAAARSDASHPYDAPSKRARFAARCARALLHPGANPDWFGWRFGQGEDPKDRLPCSIAIESRAFELRASRTLAASGMPSHWNFGAAPNDEEGLTDGDQDELDAALKSLPAERSRIDELKVRLAKLDDGARTEIQLRRNLEDEWSEIGAMDAPLKPSSADISLAASITRLLERPLHNPYHLETKRAGNDAGHASRAGLENSCANDVVRCFESEGVRWELVVSKDYDPSGEVPAAGYWLRRTEIAPGVQRSYYLGLKDHNPFEIVPTNEPIIDDLELSLEVRRAQIDPNSIMFPPIALDITPDGEIGTLRARLADIMKDSDEDGLTDLAEQQLLLDPENPDTDADGIPDASDPLPNVASSGRASKRQGAFALALSRLAGARDGAISFGVPASGAFIRRQTTDERTLYVVTDPDDVPAGLTDRRIIVLPTSLSLKSLKAHSQFAFLYPMHVSVTMLDDEHAEVIYSAGWMGGTFAMVWRDGRWRIGSLAEWIT